MRVGPEKLIFSPNKVIFYKFVFANDSRHVRREPNCCLHYKFLLSLFLTLAFLEGFFIFICHRHIRGLKIFKKNSGNLRKIQEFSENSAISHSTPNEVPCSPTACDWRAAGGNSFPTGHMSCFGAEDSELIESITLGWALEALIESLYKLKSLLVLWRHNHSLSRPQKG